MTRYNKFRAINSCYGREVVTTYADVVRRDRSTIDRFDATGCIGYNKVSLLRVNNGGHNLPGSVGGSGNKNQDIDGATEIWNFLKQYSYYKRYYYDTNPWMEGAHDW